MFVVEGVLTEIDIEMPEKLWLAGVSRRFPQSEFYILTFLPARRSVGNSIIKIQGAADKVLRELKKHPSLKEFVVLWKEKDSAVINTKTRDPWLLTAMIESGVLLEPPIRVKNGVAAWRVVSPRRAIDRLLRKLDERGIRYRLRSIGEYKSKTKLTRRQAEVLSLAIERGYYDVPKRVTLEELARELGIAKSTLSEVLRSAERKMIQPGSR